MTLIPNDYQKGINDAFKILETNKKYFKKENTMKSINVRIPQEHYTALNELSKDIDSDVSKEVRKAVKSHLIKLNKIKK